MKTIERAMTKIRQNSWLTTAGQKIRERFLRRWKTRLLMIVSVKLLVMVGCASLEISPPTVQAKSFDVYQSQTLAYMRSKRSFQLTDTESELHWNAPQQWWPASMDANEKPQRGILLVHGLGDSPWSFYDIAPELAAQGFLVRTVLLPGHGTTPYDMLDVTAEEWQTVVYEQAQSLQDDVSGEVYLGGFSTGANLALDYAYHDSDIAGLVLFSPGFKSMPFDWIAPLVSPLRSWVITPGEDILMQTPLRYMNVPINGYAQFYRTSLTARKLLSKPYEKPVFMVVAEHDSVLNTDYLLDTFQHRFTHPKSRLIWYGEKTDDLTDTDRILIRSDKLAEERISQFSHMGLLFSPDNHLYGRHGTQRICLNGMNEEAQEACENGTELWFSGWGYSEEGKVHARLTFNPYFEWQTSVMLNVLSR